MKDTFKKTSLVRLSQDLNPFQFRPDWARVISGEEEGVFGWVAVNNMAGTLLSTAAGTVGALDLGGASTQITFSPTTTSVLEDFYELKLGEKLVRLYSHSFLGYGWGDAEMVRRLFFNFYTISLIHIQRVTTRLALEELFAKLRQEIDRTVNSTLTTEGEENISISELLPTSLLNNTEESHLVKIAADHPCYPRGKILLRFFCMGGQIHFVSSPSPF